MPAPAGFWVSLDGVDGTGKTTVAGRLAERLPALRPVPEFSDAPVGRYLSGAVSESPHVISPSLLGQSLAFLSDFFHQYELGVAEGRRRGDLVLSDRGPLSKYVYQSVVLGRAYDGARVARVLDALFDLISWPDLTIYLSCDPETLRTRLLRRDGRCDEARMAFLAEFEARFRSVLGTRTNVVELHQPPGMTGEEATVRALELIRAHRPG
ncbi:MAG TPA: deoxynucleoside kinase [Longimicrobium sp.]|jgi:dTMP kinase